MTSAKAHSQVELAVLVCSLAVTVSLVLHVLVTVLSVCAVAWCLVLVLYCGAVCAEGLGCYESYAGQCDGDKCHGGYCEDKFCFLHFCFHLNNIMGMGWFDGLLIRF